MADRLTCDFCDEPLLVRGDVRWELGLRLFAGYDPMEITSADMERDLRAEMSDLVRRMDRMTAEQADEESRKVLQEWRLDACGPCRRVLSRELPALLRRAVADARDGHDVGDPDGV